MARAEGEASRFSQLLAEYQRAPEVTRERLYLDAIESVFESSSKVMVDVEGGNNMLYLPLDRINENRSSPSTSGNTGTNQQEVRAIVEDVIREFQRNSSTSGAR